jgi:hypothetical protein
LGAAGLFLLLIGVAFLIQHAYVSDWLSPQALVIIAVTAGLAILGFSQFSLLQGRRGIGLSLLAFSAGILQFAIAWGHDAHALFSHGVAVAGYATIAALTLILSVLSRSQPATLACALAAVAASIGVSIQAERIGLLAPYLFTCSVLLLLAGIRRKWEYLRCVAWLAAALPLSLWLANHPDPSAPWGRLGIALVFFLLFHAEITLALARARLRSSAPVTIVLHLNNLAFFACVVYLLEPVFSGGMGLVALLTALGLWIGAGRIHPGDATTRRIRQALRIDGAVLIASFAPLQFDGPMVPAVMCAQAVVTAAFCRRLATLWPAIYCSGIIAGAMLHIVGHDYFLEEMTDPWTLAHGFDFTWLTVLTAGAAVAGYLVAALLFAGRTVGAWETGIGASLIAVATLLLFVICTEQSDRYYATYWWIAAAAAWCVAGLRFPIAGLIAGGLALATTAKFLAWDTLGAGIDDAWGELSGPILNRGLIAGAALALLLLFAVSVTRRVPPPLLRKLNAPPLTKLISLSVPVVITWTGTFEILRIFAHEPMRARFTQADLAMQVALSLFWSGSATLYLIIGLIRSNPNLRLFAMAQFGLVVAKVLFMDLAYLETVYRVVSFVALGMFLLVASLLYHRFATRATVVPAR